MRVIPCAYLLSVKYLVRARMRVKPLSIKYFDAPTKGSARKRGATQYYYLRHAFDTIAIILLFLIHRLGKLYS